MKSRCPCTSTAWENTKQIALCLVGFWFSVFNLVQKLSWCWCTWGWACWRGATGCLSCGGIYVARRPSLACSLAQEHKCLGTVHGMVPPTNGGLGVLFGWQSLYWSLPFMFWGEKKHTNRLKGEDAHWQILPCVYPSGAASKHEHPWSSVFCKQTSRGKNLHFRQDIPREGKKNKSLFFLNKTKQSFLEDSIKPH